MLKMTRTFGIGVLLVVASFIFAIYGIATEQFFFGAQGQGITLLITFGLGIFTVLSFYAATKIKTSDFELEEEEVKHETVVSTEKARVKSRVGTKEGFVHP